MSVNIFLLFCILLPGCIRAPPTPEEKENAVNILLKRTAMIAEYARLWKRISEKQPKDDGENEKISISFKIENLGIEETMAALFQIYTSIRLNIWSIACAVFSTEISNTSFQEISNRCVSAAQFFAWYTRQFTAKSFYDASPFAQNPELQDGFRWDFMMSTYPEITIHSIVPMIDQLTKDLNSVNEIFLQSRSNNENFIQKLNEASIYKQPNSFPIYDRKPEPIVIEKKYRESEIDFLLPGYISIKETEFREKHDDLFRNLWNFMGPNVLKVHQYFQSLVGTTFKITDVNHIIAPLEMSFEQWTQFEKFNPPTDLSSVESVLDLEVQSFQITTTVLNFPVPDNTLRDWELEENPSKITDYRINLTPLKE